MKYTLLQIREAFWKTLSDRKSLENEGKVLDKWEEFKEYLVSWELYGFSTKDRK